jgi:hypothetical protein
MNAEDIRADRRKRKCAVRLNIVPGCSRNRPQQLSMSINVSARLAPGTDRRGTDIAGDRLSPFSHTCLHLYNHRGAYCTENTQLNCIGNKVTVTFVPELFSGTSHLAKHPRETRAPALRARRSAGERVGQSDDHLLLPIFMMTMTKIHRKPQGGHCFVDNL